MTTLNHAAEEIKAELSALSDTLAQLQTATLADQEADEAGFTAVAQQVADAHVAAKTLVAAVIPPPVETPATETAPATPSPEAVPPVETATS